MIQIRTIKTTDCVPLKSLLEELNYKRTLKEIEIQIQSIQSSPTDLMIGAVLENKLIGWLHVTVMKRLTANDFAEIVGLIISKEFRKQGIGKSLIEYAYEWAMKHQLKIIRVRCNSKRLAAHQFYNKLAFESKKEQLVFYKSL